MNHYSIIHTQIWADKKFQELSSDERVLFIYFLSSPVSNMIGYYWLPMMYALNDLKWDETRFRTVLNKLESLSMVYYDEENSVVFVRNFMRYNAIKSVPQVTGSFNALKAVPVSPLIHKFLESWKEYIPASYTAKTAELNEYINSLNVPESVSASDAYPIDTVSVPYQYPTDTVSIPYQYPTDTLSIGNNEYPPETETETVAVKDKTYVRFDKRTSADDALEPEPEPEPEDSDPPAENPSEDGGAREKGSGKGTEYTVEFEEFWEVYPRRVRKKDAFKHWTPVIAKGVATAEIVAAAKAYSAAMRHLEREPDKIMHPQTFIMADRWRDWLPPDGQEYLDAQETYRRTRRVQQPRAQPRPEEDAANRYSQYDEVVWNGSDYAGEEDSA